MPRLRNSQSGAVVSVSEEKATRMGSEWVAADVEKPKTPTKKSTSSKTEK